jgi:hypothetical protein
MSIAVFVHDSAVRLIISLTDGGIPYHIESGGRAVFYGKRPDDTPLCHNCMIDDTGRIIYDFNDQTASVEGITDCQIRIYGRSRELVSAPRFIIVADERPVNDADIEKQEDSPLAALDEIQFAEIERVDAETARAESEKARADAEAERITNEQARIDAEAVRIKNENERIDAEAERIKNEEARIEAETAQNQKISELEGNITDNERRLNEIEEHLAPKYIITDDKTAYKKDVPANACSKAQLNSIGGMTYVDEATNTFVDAKVTELKAYGANWIPFPYADGDNRKAYGVTWTVNADGSITANGTATGVSTFIIAKKENFTLPQGTYMLSGCSNGGSSDTYYCVMSVYNGNTWITEAIDFGAGRAFKTSGLTYTGIHIVLAVKAGTVCNNLVFKPMLNIGDTALPYEPFKEETIFQIPPKIQALDNYGKMFTELDLVNKKFSDRYAEGVPCRAVSGRFSTYDGDDGNLYTSYWVDFEPTDAQSYEKVGLVTASKEYDSVSSNGVTFTLTKTYEGIDYGADDFEWIAQELFGDVTAICEKNVATETPVQIDNNIIKVTAGGAIEFVSDIKKAVPSSISYMMGGHLLEKEV